MPERSGCDVPARTDSGEGRTAGDGLRKRAVEVCRGDARGSVLLDITHGGTYSSGESRDMFSSSKGRSRGQASS